MRCWELRLNLNGFKEMKEEKERGGIERQEKVENQLPTVQEENENEMGMDSGETEEEEEIGDQNQDWNQQEENIPMEISNENNENVELGGGEITTIEELGGFADDDCMELREEQVQMIKKGEEEEKKVLAALALFGEIVVGQCQAKRKENQDAKQLTETATMEINETNKIKELYKILGEFTESEKEKQLKERQQVEGEWGGNGRNQ